MDVSAGTRLGPYEILSRLGAGGMGEVWRARDTRLDRSVAIKILPAEFAADAQLRARFEREAKTISQLEHSHICRLYDVGEEVLSGGGPAPLHYLVMELLEGESLADRLSRGPLPLPEVARYGLQIADALSLAHRHGVVHRDLKPGNIMLTKSGAKLLDFGLAKAAIPGGTSTPEASLGDATQHKPLTEQGTLLGTFQYMSPEQIQGQEADARSDIWALGCVLYEMATGRSPFSAPNRAALIGAVLRDEPPPVSSVRPLAPAQLDRIIRTCLAKDPDERWQSSHDVANELRWISEDARAAGVPPKKRRWIAGSIAVVLVLAAVLGAVVWRRYASDTTPVVVLMDSAHPERVYDPITRGRGGTNADDLTDLLNDLPLRLTKETTSWAWHREEDVVRQNPRLILIHRSCFYVPSAFRDQAFEDEFYARSADKLEMFLGYVAARSPATRFLVYSRGWNHPEQWTAAFEKRFPIARGRVVAMRVPLDRATFRHPQTGAEIRKKALALLALD